MDETIAMPLTNGSMVVQKIGWAGQQKRNQFRLTIGAGLGEDALELGFQGIRRNRTFPGNLLQRDATAQTNREARFGIGQRKQLAYTFEGEAGCRIWIEDK